MFYQCKMDHDGKVGNMASKHERDRKDYIAAPDSVEKLTQDKKLSDYKL